MPRRTRAPTRGQDQGTLREIGVWIITLEVVVTPLAFDPRAMSAFSVVKAQAAYVESTLLFVLLALLVARHGRKLWPRTPVHYGVAAVAATYVLAAFTAQDRTVAIIGAPDRALGVLTVVSGVILYAAATALIRSRRDGYVLGAGLFAPLLPVFLYVVIQIVGRDPVPWQSGGTVFSTLGNPGVLAQYAGTLGSAAAVAACLPGLEQRSRLILAAIAILALLTVISSGTRAALIGVGVALLLVGPILLTRLVAPERRRAFALAYVGVLAVALVFLAFTPQARATVDAVETIARLSERGGPAGAGSVESRAGLYAVGIAELRDHPMVGVGPDNYSVLFGRYRTPEIRIATSSEAVESSAHSWALRVATDAGVVGLAAYVAALSVGVWTATRPFAHPIGLPAVAGLAFFHSAGIVAINDPGTDWLPWLGLAVCAISGDRARRLGLPQVGSDRRRPSLGLSLGLALTISAAAVLPQVSFLFAGHAAGEANALRRGGDLVGAIRAGQDATSRAPFRADYWHELGLGHAARADYPAAVMAFERAVAIAPYHSTYLSNLARAYTSLAQQGDRTALERALHTSDQAVAMDPNSSLVHVTRGLVLITAQRPQEALTQIQAARALDPERSFTALQVEARAFLALGLPRDALGAIEEGLPRSGDQRLGMLLLRAQAHLELGQREELASDLIAVRELDRSGLRTRDVQRAFVGADVVDVISSESFGRGPAWRIESGDVLGTLSGNILTTGASTWRAVTVPIDGPNVRVSVQFFFPAQVGPSDPFFLELGRRDGLGSVSMAQLQQIPQSRLLWTSSGATTPLRTADWVTTRTGTWYWLELDIRARQVTGALYESGERPQPKANARLIGALGTTLTSDPPRSGPVFINVRSTPPVQIGGLGDAPGGFYVERLRASSQ